MISKFNGTVTWLYHRNWGFKTLWYVASKIKLVWNLTDGLVHDPDGSIHDLDGPGVEDRMSVGPGALRKQRQPILSSTDL